MRLLQMPCFSYIIGKPQIPCIDQFKTSIKIYEVGEIYAKECLNLIQ
jgi:hypothetical protein